MVSKFGESDLPVFAVLQNIIELCYIKVASYYHDTNLQTMYAF